MKIETMELWPGHWYTQIRVGKFRNPYRWFNLLFARANRRHEYAIVDDAIAVKR